MNRIDRLMGILTVLQSKKYSTAEFISEKFDISVRTVYRDVKALNEIGVPVSFEAPKGYFIVQGYFLPPLMFTTEEANALILLATLAERFSDKSIAKQSESALHKIKAVLRHYDKEKVEHLASQIDIYIPETERSENGWLMGIQDAIANKRVLEIQYVDNKGNSTTREIEPIGLVFYTMQWHLFAWCRMRKEYRDFKVRQITGQRCTDLPFSKNNHLTIEDYTKMFKKFSEALP
ncbi:MAG: YafY family transcriptional regulator [Filimonas sp.]|nr:YafY family transcriptional regulator [Filimonas sp.]